MITIQLLWLMFCVAFFAYRFGQRRAKPRVIVREVIREVVIERPPKGFHYAANYIIDQRLDSVQTDKQGRFTMKGGKMVLWRQIGNYDRN